MLWGYLPFDGRIIIYCSKIFWIVLAGFFERFKQRYDFKNFNPDPEDRITIDSIKKHRFYLKGKKLCNLDYESIENFIIKRRNRFEKKKIKNLNLCKEKKKKNKSENYLSENIQKNTEKNS